MKKTIAIIVVVVVLIILNGYLLIEANRASTFTIPKDFADRIVPLNNEIQLSSSTVTIGMIGDILLHNPLYTYENYDFAFQAIKQELVDIDFLLANQESMPGGVELGLSGYPEFNSPKHIIRDLKANGVDMLSLANNHTLDRGEKGVRHTHTHLNEYSMPYVGAYASFEDMGKSRIIEIEGITIGVLAYTYGTNGIPIPNGKDYLVTLIDKERIEKEVSNLSKLVDVVAVSMHWGNEYHLEPSSEQEALAAFVSKAGADIIFGHHPHVLQKFEEIGETKVFYSIGNFYSAQQFDSTNIGGIARVSATKTNFFGKTLLDIHEPRFYPTAVVKNSEQKYVVVPLDEAGAAAKYDKEWVAQHLSIPKW